MLHTANSQDASAQNSNKAWHACTECKRRKVKCSGKIPRCSNCMRHRKDCIYESPQQRITALQSALHGAESRCHLLEHAWRQNNPEVDLERVLESLQSAQAELDFSRPDPGSSHSTHASRPGRADEDGGGAILAEHSNAEQFEFDETQDFDDTTDGTGSLIVEPSKSGYTGPQSGIAALKFLQSLPSCVLPDPDSLSASTSTNVGDAAPSQLDINKYVDCYFATYHNMYPLLHEGTFRARASGALAKPKDGSWPILYYAVLAMGAFACDQEGHQSDFPFYRLARQHLTMDILEKGSLTYVQGVTILANYLTKRNKPNSAFVLLGIGWSMGLAIGLHREFGARTNPFTMEMRRRTWWAVYNFVSSSQLTLGRPPASLIGITVAVPSNLDDLDMAVDSVNLPESKPYATTSSCHIATIRLAQIANLCQAELLARPVSSRTETMRLHQLICQWRADLPSFFNLSASDLPPWFDCPRRIVVWRHFHLRIILTRPVLLKIMTTKTHLDAEDLVVSACLNAASECVTSIHEYLDALERPARGLAWYATYWLITASFVQATCYVYDQNHPLAPGWRSDLHKAMACLAKLGLTNTMASRACQMIEQFLMHRDGQLALESVDPPPSHNPQFFEDSLWQYGFSSQTDILMPSNSSVFASTDAQSLYTQPEFQEATDVEWLDAAGGIMLRSWYQSVDNENN